MGKVEDIFIFNKKTYSKEEFLKLAESPKIRLTSKHYMALKSYLEENMGEDVTCEIISNLDTNIFTLSLPNG